MPFQTRKEFDEYRAEHPELEPFPPYDFRVSEHAAEEEPEEGGGASRGHSPFVNDLGVLPPASTAFFFV